MMLRLGVLSIAVYWDQKQSLSMSHWKDAGFVLSSSFPLVQNTRIPLISSKIYYCKHLKENSRSNLSARHGTRIHTLVQRPSLQCCSERNNNVESSSTSSQIAKFASQRAYLTCSLEDFTIEEVNNLFEWAGKERIQPDGMRVALENSLVVVAARLLSDNTLVGFARAITDWAYNATIVEVVTDRRLPKPEIVKRNMVERLIKEARTRLKDCSIALIAPEEDTNIYTQMDFEVNPRGIRMMAMGPEDE
eukprot:jgi/Galph1/1660/GphlegSOOS_G361.1